MVIRIRTDEVIRAADEAAACGKRLRYVSSELSSTIKRLKNIRGSEQEELELSRQNDSLESYIIRMETLSMALRRIADEFVMAEESVLDSEHVQNVSRAELKVNDLSSVADMVNEVMRKV